MEGLRTPTTMEFSGNISKNWSTWIQKFNLYMKASGKDKEEDESIKVAILLHLIGDEGIEIYNTFKLRSSAKLADVIDKFKKYCEPKKNLIYERYKFLSWNQKEGQSLTQYILELKTKVATCEYEKDMEMVRDKLIMGICDNHLREKLLQIEDLTMAKAEEICQIFETSRKQTTEMGNKGMEMAMDAIQEDSRKNRGNFDRNKISNSNFNKKNQVHLICKKCNLNHEKNKCPAYGKICRFCKKMNHFETCCIKKKFLKSKKREVNEINEEFIDSDSSDNFLLETVNIVETENDIVENISELNIINEITENVKINDKIVCFKVDTGAQCNILPANVFQSLIKSKKSGSGLQINKNQKVNLVAYGGSKLDVRGSIHINCNIRNKVYNLKFLIVEEQGKPILGLETSMKCNLITVVDSVGVGLSGQLRAIFTEYKSVFEGIGTFPGKPHRLVLSHNSVPIAHAARRIPKSLFPEFIKSLYNLEKHGVIAKQSEPTDWVNNIVVTEKNKKIRICLDPSDLNKCLKREQFQIPSPEEILGDLAGLKYFTIADLKDSFYQVKLDPESSKLCTFATPLGRYKFLRLPFGINTSAEIFQRKNSEIFGDILGNKIYIDDLIIAGSTEEEHDRILKKVLDRAKECGITFNKNKFQYKKTQVKLLGYIVSENGIEVDPNRVDAIVKLEDPKNKKELLRFLGMVKYLSKFIPNLSQITSPLRELTRDNVIWHWDRPQSDALKYLRKLLTSAPILRHYDIKKPIVIQSDASIEGFGACLLQENGVVAFASRTLTDAEKRYATIERELSAIVFAVERFNYYCYGRTVEIQTDHKPLVNIFKKSINKISSRLQRLLFRLFKYDLNVTYLPGKQMLVADMLSRAAVKMKNSDKIEDILVHSNVINNLPMSNKNKEEIEKYISQDENLIKLKAFSEKGWPKRVNKLSEELQKFSQIKEEIFIADKFIFFGDRLIIPAQLRLKFLKILHKGHMGINKCRTRAQECIYWPGISRDIATLVSKCSVCNRFRKNNSKLPILQHSITNRPWEKLASDILTFKNNDYLVIVDYYSRWLELKKLKSKNISQIIKIFNKVFSVHGYPDIIVTDNVPFNSYELKSYLNERNIKLINSSPNYPRSNGLAEKAVNVAKNMLRKCDLENGDINSYLFNYRNTPSPDFGLSPAQLLLSRRLKDDIPVMDHLLQPIALNKKFIREKFENRRLKQKNYYNRHVKNLAEGKIGDRVLFKYKMFGKKERLLIYVRNHDLIML